jgi:hypothetical protein
MKLGNVLPEVLARLMELGDRADALARAADAAEAALSASRDVLGGRVPPPGFDAFNLNAKALSAAVAPIRAGFDEQLKATQRARANADASQRMLSEIKIWLARLPDDAELEVTTPDTEGLSAGGVSSRLRAVSSEQNALQSAPIPSPDLSERVAGYRSDLARCARPYVDGINAGASLRVLWAADRNANRANLSGYGDSPSVLALVAALFPQEFDKLVLDAIEADCAKPMPVAERPKRIASLRAEADVLQRLLAKLINDDIAAGGDAVHDPATPPDAVLQVRVLAAEAAQRVA